MATIITFPGNPKPPVRHDAPTPVVILPVIRVERIEIREAR